MGLDLDSFYFPPTVLSSLKVSQHNEPRPKLLRATDTIKILPLIEYKFYIEIISRQPGKKGSLNIRCEIIAQTQHTANRSLSQVYIARNRPCFHEFLVTKGYWMSSGEQKKRPTNNIFGQCIPMLALKRYLQRKINKY